MQRNSEVAAFVRHTVQAELVGHVSHRVFFIHLLGYLLHLALPLPSLGKLESSLSEVSSQDLHQAVGIAVVMNWATFTRGPD
jgi:hypothetical protein